MSVIVQNEIDDTTVPNPATGKIALFIDEADSKLKGKKPDGSVVFIGTTPLHADTHHTGGTDALAPADIGAAAATHAHAGTDITSGTVASARLPSASGTTAGIVPTTSGSATGDKLRVKADGTLEWYTPTLDEAKVSKLYESDGGAAAVEVDAAGDVTLNNDIILPDTSSFLLRTTYVPGTPQVHFTSTTMPAGWYWATNSGFDGTPPNLGIFNNTWLNVPGAGDYFLAFDVPPISGTYIQVITRIVRAVGNSYIGIRIDDGSSTTAATNYVQGKLVAGTTGYKITREDSDNGIGNSIDNIFPNPILLFCGKWKTTSSARVRVILGDTPLQWTVDDTSMSTIFTPTRIGLIFKSGYSIAYTPHYTMVDWIYHSDE